MKYKYLYEKIYNQKECIKVDRMLFDTCDDLFLYLQQQGEKIFNNGFSSAEISLCRIEEKGNIK